MDLLDDLTPPQREAVTHAEGPLLILAGAGSGKTRVITRRVAHLLQQGVKPYQILAITFTNKAAGEMRQRVEALVPGVRLWMGTFHAFGARMLRQYGDRLDLARNFTIYDVDDRRRLIKLALDAVNVDSTRFPADRIESAISKAKNQLLTPEKYAAQANDFFTNTVAKVFPEYEKRMRSANALDFDDLLLWPALGLKHNAELRAELDARFQYVLIDEYQDTNQAQYAIARGLSIDYPNLCVVGDPDQSIYGWRGANIKNILNFERDYPDARVIALERNYRSTKCILKAASGLIAKNKERKPKKLITENPDGQPVQVLTFPSGLEEADAIGRRIKEAVAAKKHAFRDVAVFMRINALSRAVEAAFIRHRIPFQIVRGLAFYDRKENKDILAYLRLLVNPRDDISFERVVNEPSRGIGKVSVDHLRNYAEPRELSLLGAAAEADKITTLRGKAADGFRAFAQLIADLTKLKDMPPDEVMRQVLDRTGYRKMLKESTDPEDVDRLANIEELITAARQAAEGGQENIAEFLESVALSSDVDGWNSEFDRVSVMTLHAAKGLEFPIVFMLAVEQGLLPHERSLQKKDELEEERRLAFVGMTRAKEELYICHARSREFRGMSMAAIPSMFLDELPSDGSVEHEDQGAAPWSPWSSHDDWADARFHHQRDRNFGGGHGGRKHGSSDRRQGAFGREQATRQIEKPAPEEFDESHAPAVAGKYVEGMMVQHEKYGVGRVTAITGHGTTRRIKVRFSAHGEKTFIANVVKLAVVK